MNNPIEPNVSAELQMQTLSALFSHIQKMNIVRVRKLRHADAPIFGVSDMQPLYLRGIFYVIVGAESADSGRAFRPYVCEAFKLDTRAAQITSFVRALYRKSIAKAKTQAIA